MVVPLSPAVSSADDRLEIAPPRPVEIEVHIASSRARRIIAAGYRGRVLGSYRHGIVALDRRGRPLHLTSRKDGMGPYSIWVDPRFWPISWAEEGPPASTSITGGVHGLQLGSWRIMLDRADDWDPRPTWRALGSRLGRWIEIARDLAAVTRLERTDLPDDRSWLRLHAGRSEFRRSMRREDGQAVARAACSLAGLGPGLTPAGDDYMAGVLLGMRATPTGTLWGMAAPAILNAVTGSTTTLSTALLAAAFRGEAARPWHALVWALAKGDADNVPRAAASVRRLGHSSGTWSLAGFLDTVLDATEGAGCSPPPP